MAILSGIGRALTSLGTDMTRQREEREDRERRLSDLKEARAYDTSIRDQQARIRANETQANRNWSKDQERLRREWTLEQEEARRLWEGNEANRRAGVVDARTALQNTEYDARADRAADRALDVREDIRAHDAETRDLGAAAYDRALSQLPGTRMGYPAINPNARWGPTSGADVAAIRDAGMTPPTQAAPRPLVQPTEALMERAEQDIYEEQGAYDEFGKLVGDPASARDVYNRASRIANRQLPVEEPSITTDTYTPPTIGGGLYERSRRQDQVPTEQPVVPLPIDTVGTSVLPPSGLTRMTEEEFQVLVESGEYTDEELSRIWTSSTPGY